MSELVAISIQQPWATAILAGYKDVENRTWQPPRWRQGERIVLHAGKKFDAAGAETVRQHTRLEDLGNLPRGAFLGSAVLAGWHHANSDHCYCDPAWAMDDQWHWRLGDVRMFDAPIPGRGALGFFDASFDDVVVAVSGRVSA